VRADIAFLGKKFLNSRIADSHGKISLIITYNVKHTEIKIENCFLGDAVANKKEAAQVAHWYDRHGFKG
jgi:hypothetical protein